MELKGVLASSQVWCKTLCKHSVTAWKCYLLDPWRWRWHSIWTVLHFTDEEATAHGSGKLTQGSLVIERPVTQGRIVWIKDGDNRTQLPGFSPSPAPCKLISSCLCFLIFKMGIIRIVPTSWVVMMKIKWVNILKVLRGLVHNESWGGLSTCIITVQFRLPISCVTVLRPSFQTFTPWKMENHNPAEDARKFL